ncbi:unnamed protein product [Diatraea saccharalis]|uniref:Uncharacterized protein n=1 Tax=Diatraea saccharalis TaxID=40085 RepID=A0A9N9RE16_9NEOP|nr:unnamed protein product [Diatraea saccharalis]
MPKRPSELLQQVMSVFKGLDKKLDKLQDDVNSQNQTLTDLRIMVANLSGSFDSEVRKKPSRKATAVQRDVQTNIEETRKIKSKNITQSLPSKIKTKSMPVQKIGLKMSEPNEKFVKKAQSSPAKVGKLSTRLLKAEAPRKATTLRTQKNKIDKKRNKTMN